MSCGARFPRLVERAFVGDLSPRRRRALRRHLAGCASCRARYDRLGAIDRSLGAGRALGDAALDAIGAEVIAGTAPWYRRPSVWTGVGAVATAAALLLALSLRGEEDAGFRPRGDGLSRGDRLPGVRMFCVAGDGGGGHVVAESRVAEVAGPLPPLRCSIEDELQLAYTSPDLEGLTMIAFGRRGDTIHVYAPRPGDPESLPLAAGKVDESLDWSTRLAVEHAPGSHEVIVRFFRGPVATGAAIAGEVAPALELRGRLEITAAGGQR